MTSTIYDVYGKQTETNQGKAFAHACCRRRKKGIIIAECDASIVTGCKYPVSSYTRVNVMSGSVNCLDRHF